MSEPHQPGTMTYTRVEHPVEISYRSNPSTPIEKESVTLMPPVDCPGTLSDGKKRILPGLLFAVLF